MLSPLEKLPPLESQNFQNPDPAKAWFSLDRISQVRPASLTREKLGMCGTVDVAELLHNPVLTLKIAADYSRENAKNRFSPNF